MYRNTGFVLLLVMALTLVMSLPVLADPFSDVPQDHWAYDAVQMLEEKGLVEGYPDGLFKGDRAMTRYEMAMVVARVIAKLEQVQASIPEIPDLSIYATKQDLETLNKLLDEFRNELDALGVRVNNIEDSLGKLTARVEELERVKISGNFGSIGAWIGISEDVAGNGGPGGYYEQQVPNPAYDPINNPNEPQFIGQVVGPVGDFDRFSGSTLMENTQQAAGLLPAYGGTDSWFASPVPGEWRNSRSAYAGHPEFALNEGMALASKLALTVTAKISDNVKAGGDLVAYSAFGDAAVYNHWGMHPQYNTLGEIAAGGPLGVMDFQADLATLWFDADGDWDITGKFGDYNLNNVSPNLFYGVRNPYFGFYDGDIIPMNGLNFSGTLYDLLDVEVFYAQDINTVANGQSGIWYLSDPGYAVTTNWGTFANFRNYMYGFWAGYDMMEDRLHIEGSVLNIVEDATSNPNAYFGSNISVMPGATQDQLMFGLKAHYTMEGDWLTIYGEWGRSEYRAVLEENVPRAGGNLFQIGAKAKLMDGDMDVYGEYVRTDPNYDPFGFHQTWERAYNDGWHDGWDDMTGYGWAVRPGKFRPNRHGLDAGLAYNFAAGKVFADFTYLKQVAPTYHSTTIGVADDDTFNFWGQGGTVFLGMGGIAGRPFDTYNSNALYNNPYNFNGNQDYFFSFNDPAEGSEFMVEIGGKYDFGGNLHVFGGWDYMKFKRDYTLPTSGIYDATFAGYDRVTVNGYDYNDYINLGSAVTGNFAVTDFAAHFTHLGVTYDVTEKFSVQGNFAYVKNSGVDDSGFSQDNSTVIPGVALRYQFNDDTSLVFDYKYFSFSDDRVTANDYNANKIVTRFNVKF